MFSWDLTHPVHLSNSQNVTFLLTGMAMKPDHPDDLPDLVETLTGAIHEYEAAYPYLQFT